MLNTGYPRVRGSISRRNSLYIHPNTFILDIWNPLNLTLMWRPFKVSPSWCFWLVLALVWIATGSMRRFLNPAEDTQVVQLLQQGRSPHVLLLEGWMGLPASPEHGVHLGRLVVVLEELDRVVKGPQPVSRTSTCSFVPGGTGRALLLAYRKTSRGPLVWVSLAKPSGTDLMEVAWVPHVL